MKIRDEAVTTPGKVGRSIGSGYDRDTVGRWSEAVARGMGGGKFLIIQTLVVIAWIALNAVAGSKGLWDEYPFILLNLLFSIEAAYSQAFGMTRCALQLQLSSRWSPISRA